MIEAGQRYDITNTEGRFFTVIAGGPTTGGGHPAIGTHANGETFVGNVSQGMIDRGVVKLHVEGPTLSLAVSEYLAALDDHEEERNHRHPSPHAIKSTWERLEKAEADLRAAHLAEGETT